MITSIPQMKKVKDESGHDNIRINNSESYSKKLIGKNKAVYRSIQFTANFIYVFKLHKAYLQTTY